MHPPRPNTHAAELVDHGLAINLTDGRQQAAQFMHLRGIAFRVIVRVLAPGARVRAAAGETPSIG